MVDTHAEKRGMKAIFIPPATFLEDDGGFTPADRSVPHCLGKRATGTRCLRSNVGCTEAQRVADHGD